MTKRLFVAAWVAVLLTACAPSSLYYWGGSKQGATAYEVLSYRFEKQTPQSLCALIAVYEDMVTHPGGSRKVPPPGICAEYGYLLLRPETAETFATHANASQKNLFASQDYAAAFAERGCQMLEKEIELYPESAPFLEPLLRKLAK